jgi:hypothetical protein
LYADVIAVTDGETEPEQPVLHTYCVPAAVPMTVASYVYATVPVNPETIILAVVEVWRVPPTITPQLVPVAIPDSENVAEYGAGGGAPLNDPTCAMAVFQDWKPEEMRYSPATQNVDADEGVGSVAAPK